MTDIFGEGVRLSDEERANGFALRTRVGHSDRLDVPEIEGHLFVDLFDRDGTYLCSVAEAENPTEMNQQLRGLSRAIYHFMGE
jgi:hypothetical protein